MRTSRPTSHRTTTVAVAVLVGVAGLIGFTDLGNSAIETAQPSALDGREHEAHRYLTEARKEQERVLNPREHLAHRDVEKAPSGAGTGAPARSLDPCAVTLQRAWQRLGHFSDGYESYLLRQPPCSPSSTSGGSSSK
jgi:hypothetical protein